MKVSGSMLAAVLKKAARINEELGIAYLRQGNYQLAGNFSRGTS